MLAVLGVALVILGTVCWLIIVIDAFRSSILKGVFAVLCCYIYWLYYALVEFQHKNKWPIVLLAIFGHGVGAALVRAGGG